jgi:CheY-like chemotaxis protein
MDAVAPPVPALQIPHVLIVHASLEQQQLYDSWLITSGCRITQAREGFEALAACEADPPDVIVTAVALPLMDGLELCERLRTRPGTQHIPLIVIADRPIDLRARRDLQLRCRAILLDQPCAPHTLMTVIHAELQCSLALKERSDAARRRAAVLCRQAYELQERSLEQLVHERPAWRALLARVRRDYAQNPALTLTAPLAAARWGITEHTVRLALEYLWRCGLLEYELGNRYALPRGVDSRRSGAIGRPANYLRRHEHHEPRFQRGLAAR